MSPNEVISLAKKRIATNTSNVEWNLLYQIAIDDIFTAQEWKFARGELTFVQPASTFEKQFNADSTEISLSKIISIRSRGVTQYSLTIPPIPIFDPNTPESEPLHFIPAQRFFDLWPNPHNTGTPYCYTEIFQGDGIIGMKIGIYYLGASEYTYGVHGYFIPNRVIDANPIQFLPLQFHSVALDALIMYAAEETGLERLANRAEIRYNRKLKQLSVWDNRNPNYRLRRGPVESLGRPRILFPANFPRSWSR